MIPVAPHTGAWIETASLYANEFNFESHPTRVRGLKRWFMALATSR